MPTDQEWLDEMQTMLFDVCQSSQWSLKQTSLLPAGTRTFVVGSGNKVVTIAVSTNVIATVKADLRFERDDIDYDRDQMRRRIARKLR